ncbi:MAG TPA: non-homologous end-joining DNA ligase [Gemmatimonadota bacterium]|nr:non-homologous end-joining DNA ligase [Gemmatimonadota bacterium]
MASSIIEEIGGHAVELSNREKVFFPDAGITKGDVVDYYRRIAPILLPHLADRPLTLQRFPDGISARGFYQRDRPAHFPPWIESVRLEKVEGGTVDCVVCGDEATLAYLADQGALTLHAWLSRRDRPGEPDRMIFDLDPPGGHEDPVDPEAFGLVVEGARAIRDLLAGLGLEPHVMTTGSRGVHVTVPLERGPSFAETRAFARDAADLVARRRPRRFTIEQRKAGRRDRLYLDCMRNAYGQTGVAPYAVRARPGAPIATPLDWDELGGPRPGPRTYTIRNIFRRLGQRPDPWRGIAGRARPLGPARGRLDELRRSEIGEEEA